MDRPLGKKFNPRPKRIHRSDGSYWVANPCVSEHFLTQQIGEIDRQKIQYNATQSKQLKELERELKNIKTTKSYRPGPGYFRRRGSRQHTTVENSFSDMIDKFNKRRVEQDMVNKLLKQRRESMYSMSAGTNRKSVSHIWENVVDTKADLLNLDFEQDQNYEGIDEFRHAEKEYNATQNRKRNTFQRKLISKRKDIYEVPPERYHADFENERPEETSYKHISQDRPRPSYASDRGKRNYKPVSHQMHHTSRDLKHNKVRSRAANLWGLVREKALGPDDIKSFRHKLNNDDNTTNLKENNDNSQVKTDDQKLFEKEMNASSTKDASTEKPKFLKKPINPKSSNSIEKSDEQNESMSSTASKRNDEKLAKNVSDQHNTSGNISPGKCKIPNGHIPNSVCNSSTSSNSPVKSDKNVSSLSLRPKSAKGRTRVNTENLGQQSENGEVIEEIFDEKTEHKKKEKFEQCMSSNRKTASCGDGASLNNYLHSEMSENEISRNSDRKLSCFDLNFENSFPDHNRPEERMGHVITVSNDDTIRRFERSRKDSGGARSRKHSTSSHKTSETSRHNSLDDDALEKSLRDKESEELWDDVRRCRYLRGYDPPEMVMPANVNIFVFGKDENDIIEEMRLENLAKNGESNSDCDRSLP